MINNLNKLANLYAERKLNKAVYKAELILKDTYEKVDKEILSEIHKLEKICHDEELEKSLENNDEYIEEEMGQVM